MADVHQSSVSGSTSPATGRFLVPAKKEAAKSALNYSAFGGCARGQDHWERHPCGRSLAGQTARSVHYPPAC